MRFNELLFNRYTLPYLMLWSCLIRAIKSLMRVC